MRSALTLSAAGHAALVALLVAWPLLLPQPHPDTPPQVEVLIGGGATPAPPSPPPAPIAQAQKPSAESAPSPAPQPSPSDQPTPPQSATSPATPSPTPPPPDPAKTPVADGDAGPMGDLQDPTHKILRPATADTGNLPPVYPSEAVALHEQGQVTLRLHIDTEGKVAQAEIAVSSGSAALDKAALAAISAWHFHPAQQNGKPVPDIIEMGIAFRMP